MRKAVISFFFAVVMFVYPLTALATEANVTLMVDGLSCPFCAYGLEKKIKKMDGVEDMEIDLEGGKVEIRFTDREDVDLEKIEEAVRDAGFTPRSVELQEVEE